MRKRAYFLGAVLGLACGETARKGPTAVGAGGSAGGGGRAGSVSGGVASLAGTTSTRAGGEPAVVDGGGGGVGLAEGGAATGEAGAAGAAGAAIKDGYSFQIVPPLVPPEVRAAAGGARKLYAGSYPSEVSFDGSLIVANLSYVLVEPGVSQDFDYGAFTWTNSGTQPLETNFRKDCLNAAGNVLFGTRVDGPNEDIPHLYRWARDLGQTDVLLAFSASFGGGNIESCSTDGSVVTATLGYAGAGHDVAALWREGKNSDRFTLVGVPDSADSWSHALLSGDGSSMFVSTSDDEPLRGRIFRATSADDFAKLELLANQTGYPSCVPKLVNHDGSIVVGTCSDEVGKKRAFRWSSAAGALSLFADPLADPTLMSDDGSVLLGFDASERLAAAINGQVVTEPDIIGYWQAFVGTGGSAVAYGDRELAPGVRRAVHYTAAGGFVTYPLPPAAESSGLHAISADGSLAVGETQTSNSNYPRGVLWDAQGPRDVAAELTAAGFDLGDFLDVVPEHVWSGSTIRIIGSARGNDSYNLYQTFIAELPARP